MIKFVCWMENDSWVCAGLDFISKAESIYGTGPSMIHARESYKDKMGLK
jgi:hypothetical protein